ncbi:hypothetical protein [Streptomyces acidiscabies]|uniref:Uncharacterized protein n=1 Tax=Streptomyces acidiscabies TaxID=42234 RepID=A0AAP6BLT6_9ACTN|nr:hypothetical protein [Streptomyces acidiscabies]MBP5938319.1 hypothetical protein [Streptomyces sp. LBUM 1476]MBZ3909351.1 hypothetical protein [Streptomyces acidiscabies]MDX2966862.1 hypothetical protein [Streptomyces acidiscabies]MDX3019957.1 hypothetical protein [Streptomyces acidiscabies]MDX3796734.1 hypothetical protein [Streptomyces acidiscabies]
MTSVNSLVASRRDFSASVQAAEPDALREADALQEAQLLDSRVCPLTSTAALLFELRTSLQFDAGNAALLVVRGLRSFAWSSSVVPVPFAALTVVSGLPDPAAGVFRARFDFFPAARLEVVGSQADFYVLEVDGIGDVPPDYSGTDHERIARELPSWSSLCRPVQVSTA